MSAAVRQAIADAINEVAGVDVTPYFRQTTKAGTGMVRLDRTDFPNKLGGDCTWQVVVVLPKDIATAEKWLDENARALRDAVGSEMRVESVVPQQLAIDTGALPVVVITGKREEY